MNIKATVQYTFTGTINMVADSLEEARQLVKDNFGLNVNCVKGPKFNNNMYVGWSFSGEPTETNIVVEENKSDGKKSEEN